MAGHADIKLLVPSVPPIEKAVPYIRRSEEARHWANFGPNVVDLERRLSGIYGGACVVTVANCTLGLELVYTLAMVCGYRSIELPALTFPATWLAATRSGLEIIPIDVDAETWVGQGVAGFGVPTTGPIVDAAGAFGEQRVIPGMVAVFSAHATKPNGAAEGGWIVTHDQGQADELRRMSNFYISSGVSCGYGTNAKLSEVHAAMMLAALDAYDREDYCQLHDLYDRYLPSCVTRQKRPRGAYSLMAVKVCDAKAVGARMKERGIETRMWYQPEMRLHPLYVSPGINRKERRQKAYKPLPVTEELNGRLLGLPWHLHLTESDVQRVCETLAQCVEETHAALSA